MDIIQDSKVEQQIEISFNTLRLMILLILMAIPFIYLVENSYDLIWKNKSPIVEMNVSYSFKIIIVLLSVLAHELLHGIILAKYSKNGFRSIKFGFSAKMLSPYCHCKDPVKVKHFMRAGIAPLIFIGLVPLIFAISTGVHWLMTFGLIFTLGGFGDLIIVIKLFKFDSEDIVIDLPDKIGFIIEKKPYLR